ncbi:MAG: LysE family translocator [Gemmatimonadota bacterium]|nr:LysE family translocator [Gemmatimonadota bacterium]
MPDAHSLLLFIFAGLALNVTPGPDMLYIIARSSTEGRRAGIVSALGVGAGTLVHIAALALGLAAVLRSVPLAYDTVRLAGAGYLIYLGVRALLRSPMSAPVTVERASLSAIFRQGVVTNVLNPKVALFFLAFLPQFVDPSRGAPAVQIAVLGLIFDLNGTLVNIGVAVSAHSVASLVLGEQSRNARIMGRATGVLFIGLGARVALMRK